MVPAEARELVVLVGNPNVGKSALFGALTGTYATVSNYPGTTVEVVHADAVLEGRRFLVVDTPGTASFLPGSEDERVTRDLILERRAHAVVAVADARNLSRATLLALQLAEMDVPFVLCLNMVDEAEAAGVVVDVEGLSARLGVDVVPTVAVRREGLEALRGALHRPRESAVRVRYPEAVEAAVAAVEPLFRDRAVASRALALMALAEAPAAGVLEPAVLGTARGEAQAAFAEPLACVITQARLDAVAGIAGHVLARPRVGGGRHGTRLERLTIHPVWSLPILAAVLLAAYGFVGVVGADLLVELLEERFFGGVVAPWATRVAEATLPFAAARDLLVGPYGLVTMALAYALGLILPIVTTFFVTFAVLEDSGYLPRLAVVLNRGFRAMGISGKAVLPMVLGLGCDTMATLTTRVLETPKERMITILLLALGVPCSAQLAVVLTLLGPLPAWAMVVWAGVVIGVTVLVGRLAALVLPGEASALVLELPPLRRPRLRNLAVKTLGRVEWYLKEAVPLFVAGTLILFVLDRVGALSVLERLAEPAVVGWLGLPAEAASAFVAGFLRRDFGAAGLFRLAAEGRLDVVQTLVATVVVTLFVPCVASVLMIARERGAAAAAAVVAFVVPFAVLVGGALRLALRALGVAA